MAYRHETDRTGSHPSMRVVQDGSGSGAWFVAGAVVIALVIAAFVIGSSRDTGPAPVEADVDLQIVEPTASGAAPAPETVPQTNSAN